MQQHLILFSNLNSDVLISVKLYFLVESFALMLDYSIISTIIQLKL